MSDMSHVYKFEDSIPGQEQSDGPIRDLFQALQALREMPLCVVHLGRPRTASRQIKGEDVFTNISITPEIGSRIGGRPRSISVDISYFVGQLFWLGPSVDGNSTVGIEINIRPRIAGRDERILPYLFAHAYDLYLPELTRTARLSGESSMTVWMMALMWKGALERALAKSHIPRSYVPERRNLGIVRGRILFSEHVRRNLANPQRMFCEYRRLSTDIVINRTIRLVYKHFCDSRLGRLLHDVSLYDEALAASGVSLGAVDPNRD